MLGKGGDEFFNFFKAAKAELQEILIMKEGVAAYSRASSIKGVVLEFKKFPGATDPNKGWVLGQAKKYQAQASGHADLSFKMTTNGAAASFDDIKDGLYIDRKFGQAVIFDKVNDGFEEVYNIANQNRANSLLAQADRQIKAVGGNASKIKWEISSADGAAVIKQLFSNPANVRQFPGIEKLRIEHVLIN